jgi:Ca2+-binding EF-hand superfamily protein
LQNQLQLAGMEVTMQDLDQIMAEVDLNEDGKIDLYEFGLMIAPQ